MNLRRKLTLSFFTCLIWCFLSGTTGRVANADDNAEIESNLGILKGHVEIVSHPELDDKALKGWDIIFQRMDCKRCVTGVWTDQNGDYKIILSTGTYRVIFDDPIPRKSYLAEDQPRYVTIPASLDKYNVTFNIEVRWPS